MPVSSFTWFHIFAGAAAIIAAPIALFARKGGRLHRRAGLVFVVSMGAMAMSGAAMAFARGDRMTGLVGLLTLLLVGTGWRTARRRGRAGEDPTLVWTALAAALVASGFVAVAFWDRGLLYPRAVSLAFGGIAAIAALSDVVYASARQESPTARLARHLWRMLAATFIAYSSFFLGQQKVFPEVLKGWVLWTALPLGCLAALAIWMVKVRVAPALMRGLKPRRAAP